ncbi:hypothetical protein D3C72_1164720 [compost metagenome]
MWIIYVLEKYINISGDYNILDLEIPYLEGEVLPEEIEDRYQVYNNGEVKETLLQHCKRAIDLSLQLGENRITQNWYR